MQRNRDRLRSLQASRATIVLYQEDVARLAALRAALEKSDKVDRFICKSEVIRWCIRRAADQLKGVSDG